MSNGKRKLRALGSLQPSSTGVWNRSWESICLGERKEQPHAQSFKGMCGNSYEKGGREAHVGLPLSDPDVQATVLKMPMKGSRACWARVSVFLTTKKHVKSVAGCFPRRTRWLPGALLGSVPCQLYTTCWAASEQDLEQIGLVHWVICQPPPTTGGCWSCLLPLASN